MILAMVIRMTEVVAMIEICTIRIVDANRHNNDNGDNCGDGYLFFN